MSRAATYTGIKPTNGAVNLIKQEYRTKDIIELVNEVIRTDSDDTRQFARKFTPTRAGMRKLFYFVDQHFTYREDPEGSQWVQTPSYLWSSKVGDCKSFTVFISSVLHNMGVDHIIRYVSYGSLNYRHVYPVALIDGREIPIDVVYYKEEGGPFGTEKPYQFKKDFHMEGLYKLGTVGQLSTAQQERNANNEVARIRSAVADIPEEIITSGVGDITKMTQGEWERYIASIQYEASAKKANNPALAAEYSQAARMLRSGNVAGIGAVDSPIKRQAALLLSRSKNKTQPAFEPFSIRFYEPTQVGGVFQKIGDFFKRIGKAIADAWKKLVNWVYKGVGKKMATYFTYLFLDKSKVRTPEIRRRIAQQEKTFNWMADKGKLDRGKMAGIILAGIAEQTEYSAQELISTITERTNLYKGSISGVGSVFQPTGNPNTQPPTGGWQQMPDGAENKGKLWATIKKVAEFIWKAIQFIWEVIKKIASIFKRKDEDQAGNPSESNSSDLEILEQEKEVTPAATSGGGSLLPLIALGVGAYFII